MSLNRRKFLNISASAALVSMAAFNFGCSLQTLVADKKKKVAILYATRYGSTKDTSVWIAEGLNTKVDLLDIEKISFSDTAKEYDLFIVGSGIWIDGVHNDMIKFLQTQQEELKDKVIASFILCGTTSQDVKGEARIEKYFAKFHAPLEKKPQLSEYFGGRMIIDELNEKDKKILAVFYTKVLKREFVSWDRTQPDKARKFGLKAIELT